MRDFKTEPIQARPVVVKLPRAGQGTEARLSLRQVTLLELASVIGSVLLTVWAVVPLYPQSRWVMALPALLALALIVHSQYARGESWRELGFGSAHAGRAVRLLAAPVLLSCGALLASGYFTHALHRSTHFTTNLLIVPLWGVVQQYVLQGFIYRRVRTLLVDEQKWLGARHWPEANSMRWAAWVTAGVFALVHLPNLTLTVLTFFAAALWSWVYERAPNLWVLGLSHGLLSLVVMHSLPAWLLQSMSVGYKHFLYQKF